MALLSPYDPNDLIFEELALSPSSSRDGRKITLEIKDQGLRPTCTAVAASSLMEALVGENQSAEWIWYHRESSLPGMSPRDALSILRRIGSVAEVLFPYGTNQHPTDQDHTNTKKILGCAKILTIDGVKIALNNNPVIAVLPLYNFGLEFWKDNKSRKLECYHSVLLVGYTEYGFIIQNSWGSSWGLGGCWLLPFSDFSYIKEAWAAAI